MKKFLKFALYILLPLGILAYVFRKKLKQYWNKWVMKKTESSVIIGDLEKITEQDFNATPNVALERYPTGLETVEQLEQPSKYHIYPSIKEDKSYLGGMLVAV